LVKSRSQPGNARQSSSSAEADPLNSCPGEFQESFGSFWFIPGEASGTAHRYASFLPAASRGRAGNSWPRV